jgi:hypothetical protein
MRTACFFAFLALAFVGCKSSSPPSSSRPQIVASHSLGLNAQPQNTGLRVSWSPSAAEIMQAKSARLELVDGNHRTVEELDPASLRAGHLMYVPRTNDVAVTLRVAADGQIASESLRVISSNANASLRIPPPNFELPPTPVRRLIAPRISSLRRNAAKAVRNIGDIARRTH